MHVCSEILNDGSVQELKDSLANIAIKLISKKIKEENSLNISKNRQETIIEISNLFKNQFHEENKPVNSVFLKSKSSKE